MNVAKEQGDVNLKATILNKDNARSKSTEECELLNYFFYFITMIQDLHVKLNPRLPWHKQHSTRRLFSPANWT
jgi:hypothetical protein